MLHEVRHPRIVPPPVYSPGGGTNAIEYVPVVIHLWLIASNQSVLHDSYYDFHIMKLTPGQFSYLVVGTPRSEAS